MSNKISGNALGEIDYSRALSQSSWRVRQPKFAQHQ